MANDTVYVDSLAAMGEGTGAPARNARRRQLARAGVQPVPDVERRGAAEQRLRRRFASTPGSRSTVRSDSAYLSGAVDGHAGRDLRAGADGTAPHRRGRSGAVQRARHGDGRRSASSSRRSRRCSRTCAWRSRSSVNHNTWVRNREANVEIYTDDPVIDSRRSSRRSRSPASSRPIAASTTSSASDSRSGAARRCSSARRTSIRRCRSPASIRCEARRAARSTSAC